jgi:hypothetical protein
MDNVQKIIYVLMYHGHKLLDLIVITTEFSAITIAIKGT